MDLNHIDPSNYIIYLLVHYIVEHFGYKYWKTYIVMSLALTKATNNAILCPDATLVYKYLQQVVEEDDVWNILEHILCNKVSHLGGKAEDMQKQICDLQAIST